ncbi:MAG: TonB-dependent receptor [Caulobacteraceae bacterium]|nr:TonB-dependent receptor [Caulobacteraceae bacterium]
MNASLFGGASALALVTLLAATPALAEDGAVTVTAQKGSLTQRNVLQQQSEVMSTAGSVGFIDAEALKGRYANTLRDVLKDAPGVFVETRYGQELRLSVRGSGIARGYHLRGIEVLQDGIPWNMADGSGDFYEIDPLSLRSVAVYKGGNGLEYGSSSLGGAINFVTPTAYTAIAPNMLRLEGGSFSTFRASATESRVWGEWDGLVTLTSNTADGARQHSRSKDVYLNANLGYRLNDNIETRLYVSLDDTAQQLPGSLTLAQALSNPKQAAYGSAAAISGGNQQRNDQVQRIADRTAFKLSNGQVDVDVWAYHKHLFHPIFQVIDQDGWTWGGSARYTGDFEIGGHRNTLIAGAEAVSGLNHARQYVNFNGNRKGGLTANADQTATNLDAYLEDRFEVTPSLTLTAGAKAIADQRKLDNRFNAAKSGDKTFYGLSPKVGVIWRPVPGAQVFADVTRSRDAPDFTDIAQTNTAGQSFAPLKQQKAWTYEIGTRGAYGRAHFDVTLYRAEIEGELLQYTVDPNIPASTFNAGRTVHQGVEAALSVDVIGDRAQPQAGDRLTVGGVWTLNDFHFRGDRQYGDNAIAGSPPNVARFEVRYVRAALLGARNAYLAPQVDWVPQGAYADQKNTLRAPGYTLLGLEAGFDLPKGVSVYVEARNLTDKTYISDISTVIAASSGSAIFYPGEGRSVFGGVRLAF